MQDKLYSVAELAREFNTTPRAIRLYEEKGLLNSQRVGRTMVYTKGERIRLSIVIRSKRLGFKLSEIKEFLDLYASDPTNIKQSLYLLNGARSRREQLEKQMEDAKKTISELRGLEQLAEQKLREKGHTINDC